jgi:hypothetical protein
VDTGPPLELITALQLPARGAGERHQGAVPQTGTEGQAGHQSMISSTDSILAESSTISQS